MVACAVVGPCSEPPRVAYSVGRRVGGAVVRNRVRRRLRAATRVHADAARPRPRVPREHGAGLRLPAATPSSSRRCARRFARSVRTWHEALTPPRGMLRSINLYQRLTAHRPSPCRYIPSCSEYAREAVDYARRGARLHGSRSVGWRAAIRSVGSGSTRSRRPARSAPAPGSREAGADVTLDPLYRVIGWLLAVFYIPMHSLGLAIISLTIVIMLVQFPLTAKQARSMIQMQRVQPEIKKIQQKYKDDKAKQNEELLKFYQENKINPLAGCLPMIITIPIGIAVFRTFSPRCAAPPAPDRSSRRAVPRHLREPRYRERAAPSSASASRTGTRRRRCTSSA